MKKISIFLVLFGLTLNTGMLAAHSIKVGVAEQLAITEAYVKEYTKKKETDKTYMTAKKDLETTKAKIMDIRQKMTDRELNWSEAKKKEQKAVIAKEWARRKELADKVVRLDRRFLDEQHMNLHKTFFDAGKLVSEKQGLEAVFLEKLVVFSDSKVDVTEAFIAEFPEIIKQNKYVLPKRGQNVPSVERLPNFKRRK